MTKVVFAMPLAKKPSNGISFCREFIILGGMPQPSGARRDAISVEVARVTHFLGKQALK